MQDLNSNNCIQYFSITNKNNKNNNNKTSGFSLIELSIVLIIIGLLVAGITSGQSLIESAKARAVMNEARGYMQAVNTYFAAKGRLPGDPDNTGKTGGYSGNNISEDNYDLYVDDYIAPWFDLNREGIVDYKEDDEISNNGKESKYIKKAIYEFKYADEQWSINNPYEKDFVNNNILKLDTRYDSYIPSRVVLNIDEKMDDKSLDSGSIRTQYCSKSIPDSYNEDIDGSIYVIENDFYGYESYEDLLGTKNGACDEIVFRLDL